MYLRKWWIYSLLFFHQRRHWWYRRERSLPQRRATCPVMRPAVYNHLLNREKCTDRELKKKCMAQPVMQVWDVHVVFSLRSVTAFPPPLAAPRAACCCTLCRGFLGKLILTPQLKVISNIASFSLNWPLWANYSLRHLFNVSLNFDSEQLEHNENPHKF